MKFMIHAYPARAWYVNDYLIPSMTAQGIPKEDIEVWMDSNKDGCLFSCMKCFWEMGNRPGDTWHLQDDVLISRDFAKRCQELEDTPGLISGFGCEYFGPTMSTYGRVPAIFSWFSFQCTRIPNQLAREAAEWFFNDAIYQDKYKEMVESNKCDDSFFYDYWNLYHAEEWSHNIKPCLVEHVDRLIGGSAVNTHREYWASAAWFEDTDLVEDLANKMHCPSMLLLYRQRAPESTD